MCAVCSVILIMIIVISLEKSEADAAVVWVLICMHALVFYLLAICK